MVSIVPAYASSNWGEIEDIGKKMEHSYILKKSISDAQIEDISGNRKVCK